jgi:hypothetical protein
MKRMLSMLPFLSLSLGGCAIVSGSPGATTTTASASQYEVMESQPPAPQHEDIPKLADGEVWVPGYYQPAAGTWIWKGGQVMQAKEGYKLVSATYFEEAGKVHFTPPRWRRADLVPKSTEMSAQK